MVGNGGGSHNATAASIAAAATAVGSAEPRFPSRHLQRSKWGGCWGGLSCFASQKRATRIVPASRIPDGNATSNPGNGYQSVSLLDQNTAFTPSLLAPPSSPASFSNFNSALPSTVQSPNCLLSVSANSPEEPSSTMFVIGPYAHETQLVSPPVFSAYTTEPSTAPLTPPPELAHLTRPSSPDVPFAHYLSSSFDLKNGGKQNCVSFTSAGYVSSSDLQATYPLYPGSPSSSLISPVSGTPRTGISSPIPEEEISTQWDNIVSASGSYARCHSSMLFGLDNADSKNTDLSLNSTFFHPATSAQFHLDRAHLPYPSHSSCGGRLSISRDADISSLFGSRQNKTCSQDVEEVEAYRASFGFSADELITTTNYVEISDETDMDVSFTMAPFGSVNKTSEEHYPINEASEGLNLWKLKNVKLAVEHDMHSTDDKSRKRSDACPGSNLPFNSDGFSPSNESVHASKDDTFLSKMTDIRGSKSFNCISSSSGAEVDYRRSRSLKDGNLTL